MKRSRAFIRRTRIHILVVSFLVNFCQWMVTAAGLFLLWGVVDYVFPLPLALRRGFFYVAVAAGGVFFARFAACNRPSRLRDEAIIIRVQRAIGGTGDEFLSAWQLYHKPPPGVSTELIDELVAAVEARIARSSPAKVLPFKAPAQRVGAAFAALFFLSAALYVLPPRILRPSVERMFGSFSHAQWSSYFTVQPGSGSYPQAARVDIVLQRVRGFAGAPSLRMRQPGKEWSREDIASFSSDRFGYTIEQLTSLVDYYVVWGDWRTPVFSLTPEMLPQAGDFTVRYFPPSYTGLPAQTTHGNPGLSGLAGTRAHIDARTNRDVREAYILTTDGKRFPAQISGRALHLRLVISNSTQYKFVLIDANGMTDPDPPLYDISVVQDCPPDVELVSPKDDLSVAPKSEVPLLVRAGDDFGLARVDLVFSRGERSGRSTIFTGGAAGSRTIEYLWKLEKLDLRPGEKVRYYIEARDNDAVAGPRISVTPTLTIEATDYEKEHEKIEQELKGLREELLGVLADQTVTREKLKNLQVSFSTDTYNVVLSDQRSITSSIERPVAHLNALVQRMEIDPHTDFATHREYQSMGAHLAYLRNVPLSDAVRSLEKMDFAVAQRKQDEVIARLEKMTLLSEDIWQYQRMRDLLEKGAELEQTGVKLREGSTPEELKKALQQVGDLLEKINRQLSKLPRELPEDFVNSPAVKRIEMQTARSAADAMNRALAEGDWAKAKELASSLAKQLSAISKMLHDAGNTIGFSPEGSGKLKGELSRAKNDMQAIAQKQEELLKETERIDQRRRQAMFRRQEGLLETLEKKQVAVMKAAEQWQRRAGVKNPFNGWNIGQSMELMRKVVDEFRKRRVYHSQKYLEDIIGQIDNALKRVESQQQMLGPEYAPLKNEGSGIAETEKEILNTLRGQQSQQGLLSATDEQKTDQLSAAQRELKDDTRRLKSSLEEFTRRSTSVSPEVFDGLERAAGKMQDAAGELSGRDTSAAMESGRQALECLSRGMQGMESSMETMGQEGEGAGKPVSSSIQMRSGGPGMTGMHNAPVRLPRADEYKPPPQFRREILEALKERYPLQYEKIIKEYYRRLTE